jgi:uncharacterized protein YjbI with pentapeptide repeats
VVASHSNPKMSAPVVAAGRAPHTHKDRRAWVLRLASIWGREVRREFLSRTGWKSIATVFGGIAFVWGFVSGLVTYHLDHMEKTSEAAERSYYEIVSDLASSNARVRVGALHRVPEVMLRQVPDVRHFGMWDAVKVTFGARPRLLRPYHADLRTIMHSYFVGLSLDKVTPSAPEVTAYINALIELGPEGWYREDPRPAVKWTSGLLWIWNSPDSAAHSAENPSDLFINTDLTGVNLRDFDLRHADFSHAKLIRADLRGSFLENARFNGAKLLEAKLTGAHLNFTDMVSADLDGADLEGANLRFARFKTEDKKQATAAHSFAARSDFSQCDCPGVQLRSATLIQATFSGTDLQNANLEHAMLNGAVLAGSDLSFVQGDDADFSGATITNSTLRDASLRRALFSGATIRATSFRGADLRDANFANCQGLDLNADFRNANIAGVLGLSSDAISALKKRGAVAIVADADWDAYQKKVPWLRLSAAPGPTR